MTAVGFLASMAQEGGHLRLDGDRLTYRGPESLLTPESRAFLREHRDAILAFLRTPIDRIPKSDLALFDYKRTLSRADLDWIDNAVWGNPPGEPTP